jgi:hypothetical protein
MNKMERIGTEVGNSINPELIDRALKNAERQEASEESKERVNGRSLSGRLARQVALAMAFLAPVVGIAQTNETPGKALSKEEQTIETRKNIQLAKLKAQIEIAQKKRELKEVEKSGKGNPEPIAKDSEGTFSRDKSVKESAYREEENEKDGERKLAFEGDRKSYELRLKMEKEKTKQEKVKAQNSRPIVVENPNNERFNSGGGSLTGSGGNRY